MVIATVIGIAVALTGSFVGLLVVAVPIVLFYIWVANKRKQLDQIPLTDDKPIPLHAYNTEFLIPLADYSAVAITVLFQVPSHLAAPVHAYPTPPVPALVEQLNRVTENLLIHLCLRFTTPPSTQQIQDYLETYLVQFQDENHLAVLRLNVPLAVHKHPDKPKSVHV